MSLPLGISKPLSRRIKEAVETGTISVPMSDPALVNEALRYTGQSQLFSAVRMTAQHTAVFRFNLLLFTELRRGMEGGWKVYQLPDELVHDFYIVAVGTEHYDMTTVAPDASVSFGSAYREGYGEVTTVYEVKGGYPTDVTDRFPMDTTVSMAAGRRASRAS